MIKEILTQLETSLHPVAKAIHKGNHFRVLAIAFKEGMVLKEHKAHWPSKLTVLSGSVVYQEIDRTITLSQYDCVDIVPEVTHEVTALEDSLCILSQGEG